MANSAVNVWPPDNTWEWNIPIKQSGAFEDSPIHLDDTGEIVVSDKTLEVPWGTIKIWEVTDLSSGSWELIVRDEIKDENKYVVTSEFDDTWASKPNFLNLGVESVLNVQTDYSQTLTANPLTWSTIWTVTSPQIRQINYSILKTGGVMTNVRGKFTDNATWLVLRYIPDKATWDAWTGWLTLVSWDNRFDFINTAADTPWVFNLWVNPFEIENWQQIDLELRADSINILGDSWGDPYQLAGIQDWLYEDLWLAYDSDKVQTTGLLEWWVISQNTSTTVDWTSWRWQIANYTDPEAPIVDNDVTWDAVTWQSITNIATDWITLFWYNSAWALQEKLTTALTIADSHNIIWFGSVFHLSGAIVSVVTAPWNLGYDGIGSFSDFMNLVIWPANIAYNTYSANGANLNVDVVGWPAYMLGSNFRNDPKLSDIVTLWSGTALTFQKVYQSTGVWLSVVYDGAATTAIEPDYYDNAGTKTAVTSGYWTIQRVFRSRNWDTFVAYGQQEFATRTSAVAALWSESFTEKSPLGLMLFRASLLVQEGATVLNNTTYAEFFEQSSFRINWAVGSSSSIPWVTSPWGADSNIQYNDSNTFGGSSKFCYFDTTDVTNVSIHSGSATGQANLIFRDNGAANKGYIRYDQDDDVFSMFTLSGVDINIAPWAWANVGIAIDDPISLFHVYENSANTGTSTGVTIEQDGTGDVLLQFLTTGVQRWSMGIDNSDDDKFKIAEGTGLAANAAITIDPSTGYVAIGEIGTSDPNRLLTVYHDHATQPTVALIQQDGAGDTQLEWLVPGRRWTAGIDNSDSDKWMLSPSNGLADAILTVTTDDKVGINILSPTSGLHVYENDTATDDTTGIKIEQDGTGDAALHFLITGGDNWSMGIDQSDAERFKLAPNTDVGSSSTIDCSSTDINFLSGRTNLANTSTTTFLTMDSPTATGLVGLLFKDNLDTLHGSLAYNFSLDQLQINSVIGGINMFTGLGLTQINTSSASQNYNRLVSGGASCVTGFQVENTGSVIDLEMVYNQGTDRSYIIDRSASGLEVEAVNGVLFLKSATDDILLDISSNTGRVEIAWLNHTDSHSIFNIATSDGDVDFYVGEDTPVGSVSAVGGSFYFRDDELNTSLYMKRSSWAASTSWWAAVGDVSGTNSTANSVAVFDTTGSDTIVGIDDVLVVQDTTDTEIRLNPVTAAWYAGILFYDNAKVGITADMRYNQASGHLVIQNIGSDISNQAGGNFDILMTGGSGTMTIDSTSGADTTQLMTLDTGGTNWGVADIYVTGRSPAANISALGGSFAFRDQEANSGFYIKRTSGAASTSGWHPAIVSSSLTTVDNALVTFDGTTGMVGQHSSGVTSVTTGSVAEIALNSPSATGGVAIEFYDNAAGLKLSIIHNDNTNENHIVSDEELTIQVIGAALSVTSGDDITINANSGANLITINDDFVFGETTTDALLGIKTPSATATAGITLRNNASTAEVQFEYNQNTDIASIELYNEVPLSITGTAHDDNDILFTLATQWTNAGQTNFYVGDRTPVGNVTSNPWSTYTREDGVDSAIYLHKGASANNTDWEEVLTKDERTLVYSVDVDGIDENEFILIGEYRVVDTGETGDYADDFACNNQHAAIEVNSLTGSGVVVFTGVSMSESSGIPTATTENVTVDATGKYQTDKKWLEVTNIDIPVGITAINYDVEVLGYLDMQNSDFTVTGMRIDALSKGNDADVSLHIIKVQDDGSKKCSLVDIEHYGYDAKDDLIVDDLRTGGDDRSYTATTSIWANGTNACLKVDDYSTYFTADENIIEGLNKSEGIIIHFNGTDSGNIKNVSTVNLHLTIEMN